jgi:hypothetical protein
MERERERKTSREQEEENIYLRKCQRDRQTEKEKSRESITSRIKHKKQEKIGKHVVRSCLRLCFKFIYMSVVF